jgi:hypothetical protein
MPLTFVPPPDQVWQTYRVSLTDLVGPHDPEAQFYHVPVGTLDVEEVAKGATLKDARPSGCRIIAAWGKFVPGLDGAITSCELTNPTVYVEAKFRNFVHGDLPAMAFQRIAEAGGLPAVQTGDYELHFLSIPGIQLQALHLVRQGQGSDMILPVISGDPRLSTDAVLEADQFLALAGAIAAERLALPAEDLSS